MHAEITGYDDFGNPTHVFTDDGFAQVSRSYDPREDGWIKNQLSFDEFPMIRMGQDMAYLVQLVNKLQRDNFHLKEQLKLWQKPNIFGSL